ncbi:MAG TPA: MFS transporter [Trebonia sp.]|nr:MFS transporter [Trebonia sp.]
MAMYSLGTILMITALHGDYALAGGLSAAGLAGGAVLLTRVASWVDRYGPRRVLIPQSLIFAVATAAFIITAEARMPSWLLFITGTIAASALPALGAIVRSAWSVLCRTATVGRPEGEELARRAFALESSSDDVIFIIGPALTVFLAVRVHPAAGLAAAAAFAVVGIAGLVRQPSVGARQAAGPEAGADPGLAASAIASPAAGTTTTQAAGATTTQAAGTTSSQAAASAVSPGTGAVPRAGSRRRARWSLPARGLGALGPVLMLSAAATSSIELATVAYAAAHGGRSLAGLILAGSAVGSCAGGLWYGARKWRMPEHHRLAVSLVLSALATGLLPLAPDLPVLAVIVAGVGVFIAPTLISGYSILEAQARPGRETEALSWVGFSNCVGAGVGSAITGLAVDAWGARGGYLAATVCAGLGAVVCLATLRSLGPRRPAVNPTATERRSSGRQGAGSEGQSRQVLEGQVLGT